MRRYPTSFLLLTGLGILCAIPGAIRATKSAAASGRRAMSAERWVITPPERLMAALRG